jgi:hypothetical protein
MKQLRHCSLSSSQQLRKNQDPESCSRRESYNEQQPDLEVGHDGPPRMNFKTGRPGCLGLVLPTIMHEAQCPPESVTPTMRPGGRDAACPF